MQRHGIYILASDDIFLRGDRANVLLNEARETLPDALFMLFCDNDFGMGTKPNLTALENELIDPGLFGGDRIIKIYLDKINQRTIEVLMLLARYPRDGVITIIEMPRFKKNLVPKTGEPYTEKFKASKLDSKFTKVLSFIKYLDGQIELIYTPTDNMLRRFIANLATSRYKLSLSNEVIDYLSKTCEGNLQTLDQFFLVSKMSGKTVLSLDDCANYLKRNSRFSGYEFCEAILKPDTQRALNVLVSALECSSNEILTLTNIISNSDNLLSMVRILKQDCSVLDNMTKSRQFFGAYGIVLPSNQEAIKTAARHLPYDYLEYLLLELKNAALCLSHFDTQNTVLHLKNMALSVLTPNVRQLTGL
jgi:DNA polymerase III delta subunit